MSMVSFRITPVRLLIGVVAGWVIAQILERRQLREVERIGAELGDYYGTRDRLAAELEQK